MEALFVSETLVSIYKTTLCFNSKYCKVYLCHSEHLKTYSMISFLSLFSPRKPKHKFIKKIRKEKNVWNLTNRTQINVVI
jgi:hypothetical protein